VEDMQGHHRQLQQLTHKVSCNAALAYMSAEPVDAKNVSGCAKAVPVCAFVACEQGTYPGDYGRLSFSCQLSPRAI
jgi:hypothetical protein